MLLLDNATGERVKLELRKTPIWEEIGSLPLKTEKLHTALIKFWNRRNHAIYDTVLVWIRLKENSANYYEFLGFATEFDYLSAHGLPAARQLILWESVIGQFDRSVFVAVGAEPLSLLVHLVKSRQPQHELQLRDYNTCLKRFGKSHSAIDRAGLCRVIRAYIQETYPPPPRPKKISREDIALQIKGALALLESRKTLEAQAALGELLDELLK